jgi:hypothetical protein
MAKKRYLCPVCGNKITHVDCTTMETTAELGGQDRTHIPVGRIWYHEAPLGYCTEILIEWKGLDTPKKRMFPPYIPQGG